MLIPAASAGQNIAAAGGGMTVSRVWAEAANSPSGTTVTYTGVPLSSGKHIIALSQISNTTILQSVNFNSEGATGTLLIQDASSNWRSSIMEFDVTSGDTGTLVLTFSNGMAIDVTATVFEIEGGAATVGNGAAVDKLSGENPMEIKMAMDAGGAFIGVSTTNKSSQSFSYSGNFTGAANLIGETFTNESAVESTGSPYVIGTTSSIGGVCVIEDCAVETDFGQQATRVTDPTGRIVFAGVSLTPA